MSTVTFFGHREVENHDEVHSWLLQVVEKELPAGADMFYLEGYDAFDQLVAGVE